MRYSCLRVHKKTVDFDFFQITGSKKCDAKQDKEDICSFPQINEIFARISCSVTLTFVWSNPNAKSAIYLHIEPLEIDVFERRP